MKFKFWNTINSKLSSLPLQDGQFIVSRDTSMLYADITGVGRLTFTDWIDLDTEADRLAILAPIVGKIYYVIATNAIYKYISGKWICLNETKYTDISNYIEDNLIGSKKDLDFVLSQCGKNNSTTTWNSTMTIFTSTWVYNGISYKKVITEVSETQWNTQLYSNDTLVGTWITTESLTSISTVFTET